MENLEPAVRAIREAWGSMGDGLVLSDLFYASDGDMARYVGKHQSKTGIAEVIWYYLWRVVALVLVFALWCALIAAVFSIVIFWFFNSFFGLNILGGR